MGRIAEFVFFKIRKNCSCADICAGFVFTAKTLERHCFKMGGKFFIRKVGIEKQAVCRLYQTGAGQRFDCCYKLAVLIFKL